MLTLQTEEIPESVTSNKWYSSMVSPPTLTTFYLNGLAI